MYFSNQFQGWMQSKLAVQTLFPFVARNIRKDLYDNQIREAEKHSANLIVSKRNALFSKVQKQYENTKESIKSYEMFPRGGDCFPIEAQLYY